MVFDVLFFPGILEGLLATDNLQQVCPPSFTVRSTTGGQQLAATDVTWSDVWSCSKNCRDFCEPFECSMFQDISATSICKDMQVTTCHFINLIGAAQIS